MPVEIYTEKVDFNKVVGTVDLGSYTLLIYPRKEGGYFLRPAKSNRADFIHAQTKDLAPNSNASFVGLDPDLLEIIEVGAVLPPQTSWKSGSGVLDEPQISIPGTDAFELNSSKVTLYDNEIADLFLKPKDSKDFKSASLIYLNTSAGDIMGIAVRRNSPVVVLVAPSIDASRMSSKEGMNSLLTGILSGLTSKMTSFQVQVFNALAEANSENYFQMPYDSTTLGGKLQNNLLMQIYTAKMYFLARDAEVNGEGINNAALLEHFPYLKTYGKKGGLGGLFAGVAKTLRVDPKIWDELVEDASKGINLKNPKDKTPRPTKLKPLEQRGLHLITQKIAQPGPVVAAEVKPTVDTERVESIALTQKPLEALAKFVGSFAFTRADRISQQDLTSTIDRLTQIKLEFGQILASKKVGRPPATPTPISFQYNASKLKAFGINGEKILEFLSPTKGQDYRTVVERATSAWVADSKYQDVSLRNDPRARLADSLQTSNRLENLAKHVMVAMNLRDPRMINRGYDLVYMSYLLLVEKTIYTLGEAGAQLRQTGQTVEINNWAYYCNVVLERLIKLGTDIK